MKNFSRDSYFLILCLALLIFPVWYIQYFSTIDGPSHLANSVVIYRLLTGICPVTATYYHFTPAVVPNWIGHFIMACLSPFIKARFAEKILISIYITGFAACLYSLVKTINVTSRFFIIPLLFFCYNYTFFGGGYNCLLSIVIYFFLLNWWFPRRFVLNTKTFIQLTAAFLLLYVSHMFGFVAFCFSIAWISFFELLLNPTRQTLAILVKRAVFCFCALIPSILLLAQYMMLDKMPISGIVPLSEKFLYILIPTAIYLAGNDIILIKLLSGLIWIMVTLLFTYRISTKQKISVNDWPGFLAIGYGIAVIIVPSSFGGGWGIEIRLQLLYWLFILLWAASHNFSNRLKFTIIVISLCFFLLNMANKIYYINKYNIILKDFAQAENYVAPNSTVLSVDISPTVVDYKTAQTNNHVPMANITSYMITDGCNIDVANYHASEKNTFPISYNDNFNPYLQLGTFRTDYSLVMIPPKVDIAKYEAKTGTKINYIILRGKKELMYQYDKETGLDVDSLYANFMEQVNERYNLIYSSPSTLVNVYKAKN